jgi:N,N'-diacetyllegionaminate synthase
MTDRKHVIIIAEAGVNHNGDINMALRLVREAAKAGADFVKFQTFSAEALVSRDAKKAPYQLSGENNDEFQYNMLKALELTPEQHDILITECYNSRIGFLSSAFDLQSLDYLNSLNLSYIKIPSGELTNLPYLKKAGRFKRNILLSTGMCTLEEVEAAIQVLINSGTSKENITLLHCNTAYPTPYNDVHLHAMSQMNEHFQLPIGYSDHTLGVEVAVAAVALGATVIEKHFTLDQKLPGPDHKASLEPNGLATMVQYIRNVEMALGNAIKTPSLSELVNITIARKSIHLSRTIAAGHLLTEADLIMKRPGDGISPMAMDTVIGKKIKRELKANHKLNYEDLV